jgi:hypothetical protein
METAIRCELEQSRYAIERELRLSFHTPPFRHGLTSRRPRSNPAITKIRELLAPCVKVPLIEGPMAAKLANVCGVGQQPEQEMPRLADRRTGHRREVPIYCIQCPVLAIFQVSETSGP